MSFTEVEIHRYDFNSPSIEGLSENHYVKDLWPLVYILSDGIQKIAYVGETTDAISRMSTHLKHKTKSQLTSVHMISSEKFNKSATLDIEANLIKYMSGDNLYTLLNGNLGLANHNYYQKPEYWNIFNSIWNKLIAAGITKHSIEHINNSDLFKYSPYKSLSKEQQEGLYAILNSLLNGTNKSIVVEGGAGTGKTILAIFLFKMLSSATDDFNFKEFGTEDQIFIDLIRKVKERFPNPEMALVVPMSSFRSTLKKVFKHIKGLKSTMVIGPAEVSRKKFDLLVVDESHRLRRRVNLGAYFGAFDKASEKLLLDKEKSTELDWILKQSDNSILFYDDGQSIKPSDVPKVLFDRLKAQKNTELLMLKSQFRVRGGNAYVSFIDKLLQCRLDRNEKFSSKDYEFVLFDSLEEMVGEIKARNEESGLSRLIAGYAWEWRSKNMKKGEEIYDIEIENVKLRWNSTSVDWINSYEAIDEVGCIHTTQGYDLNYSGIIFGNEISYDPVKDEIIIKEDEYRDRYGKQSIKSTSELKSFIINIYKTIMLRGIKGTYVYICDSLLRSYFESHIQKNQLKRTQPIIPVKSDSIRPFENAVPLYSLQAAAGEFGEQQQVEGIEWIQVPEHIKLGKDHFACQVIGESMNKIIPNASYCLFKKYSGGSRNGQIVLVESTDIHDSDLGSCYTVKEYESKKYEDELGWKHQSITLKPRSFDASYSDIILEDDQLNNFRVIGVFECVI